MRRKFVLGALLALAITRSAGAQDYWEVRGSLPTGYGYLNAWAAAVVDGRIFVFAASSADYTFEFVPGATPLDDTWIQRASRDAGTSPGTPLCPNDADPVSYVGAAVIDRKIYVPGGGGPGSYSADSLAVYDPTLDAWVCIPSPMPFAVNNYAVAASDGKLYVSGGCCGNRAALQIYDPVMDAWTVATSGLSVARTAPAGVAMGAYYYTIGGYTWPGNTRHDTVDVYDTNAGTMAAGPPMPTPREGLAAVACGSRIYAFGGTIPGSLTTTVEYLDTTTQTWHGISEIPQMPLGSAGPAVMMDGQIWLFPNETGIPLQVFHTTACAGACCIQGRCHEGSVERCHAHGGEYLGDGTRCAGRDCTRGACCIGDGCHGPGPRHVCEVHGGSYQGNGTLCSDVNCSRDR